ncbi:MAG TPA: hypothetical protein VGK73_25515 [Polyangiaceae bacterium]
MMRQISKVVLVSFVVAAGACSSEEGDDDGASGAPSSGAAGMAGKSGAGGSSGGATGGSSGSGGKQAGGTAGTAAGSGGSSGNSSGNGGGAGKGGAGTAGTASGAAGTAGGGESGGSGGDAGGGGTAGDAGSSGSGGSGGSGGSSGEVTPKSGMNFFVTSKGMPNGGNLGSVEDADDFCKELATAVSAELGAKTWRAYLSTSSEDARDRIGTGPWRNQAGVVIAENLEDLHAQEAGEALDDTWPPGDTGIALDETGGELENAVHDILTGSNADGTVSEGNTCNDWTSQSEEDTAGVGHSNRSGGGRPPYFNATHTVGCGPLTSMNYEMGTVSSGGGRGSFYCFALEPSPEP